MKERSIIYRERNQPIRRTILHLFDGHRRYDTYINNCIADFEKGEEIHVDIETDITPGWYTVTSVQELKVQGNDQKNLAHEEMEFWLSLSIAD